MALPSCAEVLARVHDLAESGCRLYVYRRARQDATALGYQDDHILDVLYDIRLDECEAVVAGLYENPQPILICVTRSLGNWPERLYVKVQLPCEKDGDLLNILSFKEDGKPG
jgi:hypothetical protein